MAMENDENVSFIPDDYRPITTWGYLGYGLLFSLPFIGIITILIFSFGGTSNINLRNYARSYFCIWSLGFVLSIILFIFSSALR